MRPSQTLCLLALSSLTFGRDPINQTITGRIDPSEVFTFIYVPFEVQLGTTSIFVKQTYSFKSNGNALDLGVLDQRGLSLDASRGWSGGFRDNFTITPSWATPGYNAGPIEPGTWNVVLGPYTSLPEGIDWILDIEMGFEPVEPGSYFTATSATMDMNPLCATHSDRLCPANGDGQWLRVDFHMHSVYSDGSYTPEQQIEIALEQGLDFIFFSEHNTDSANNIMGAFQDLAPDLLIGRAIEVTTRAGHWQAIGLDMDQLVEWRYRDSESYISAADEVHRRGGLVSINHPFAECSACDWGFDVWDKNDAVEVWNGEWDRTDEQALSKWQELLVQGYFTTAIGGSDSHAPPARNGVPTTVVQSRGKAQAAIVEGVRAGRVYLVQGPGMEISFKVVLSSLSNSEPHIAEIGDKVRASTVGATALLGTTGLLGQRACFVTGHGYVHSATIGQTGTIKHPIPSGARFIRVEVRNATDDSVLGLTNPIWFLQ